MQTVKLKAMASSGESLQIRLGKFLLACRNAPHAFTGEMRVSDFSSNDIWSNGTIRLLRHLV